MNRSQTVIAVAVLPLLIFSTPATAATDAKFEVASIKPAPPMTAERMRAPGMQLGVRMDRAQATFGGMSLAALISYAYGVKLAHVSGPEWLTTQRFDIAAKLPDGASTDHVPEMVRALLTERFELQVRHDTKEFPVYALVAAKTGIKLTPRPGDFDPRANTGQIALPILSLTLMLEQIVDLPVVDQTGLQGQYLFPAQTIQRVILRGTTSDPENSDVSALLLPAGMRLEKKKAILPIVVVESMRQTPTGN